ncbi:MAG: rhodanese-like domain-containing protein [Acidobacteriota bacterium]|nr:rhodanese-like domain-containing protein [Acidobacteriota bacterium]
MRKLFRNHRLLLLGTFILLLPDLHFVTGGRQTLSCSRICRTLSAESLAGVAYASLAATQQETPSAAAGTASSKKPMVHPEVPRIPAEEVKKMLETKADFVIVDTNPNDFFETWHIPTAINLPYTVLMDNPDKREEMLGTLPKDKLIVLYCLCEEGADSSAVALMLRKMDYRRDKVKVLEGGLVQWDAKNYPMIKTEIPE